MKSSVCVDASFIVRTLVPEPLSEEAVTVLEKWQKEEVRLIAPALLMFEVTSVLRRLVYAKAITPSHGEEAFTQFLQMNITLTNRRSVIERAWKIAQEFNQPRIYDAAYLAFADLEDCEFWTADERLYNTVKDKLKWVKWLGSLANAS